MLATATAIVMIDDVGHASDALYDRGSTYRVKKLSE